MNEYNYEDFKKDIIESGLETMFIYNEKKYSLSIEPDKSKLFCKKKIKPQWVLYNETDNFEVIKAHQILICDEIILEGHKLQDIWGEVQII
ncbi:MAG: hypothetical protein JEZ05_01880 [Tenericutes bacterium]|nr:hypothetical protein [Mycoplasmatota bacterium]